jgi:inosose dehydratase
MSILTRRRWLQAAAVAAWPLARARPAEPAAAIRFGFSLYGMKALKTADALKTCAEIGYAGVELALMPGWPTEPKSLTAEDRRELRQRLADTGQALLGLMENLAEPAGDQATQTANLDRLKRAAELGQTLAPAQPPVIETILGGKPGQWDQVKGPLVERLKAWAEVAADAKTVVAVKPHVANALHAPEAALWLIQQVNSPWLKLAFDFSHFTLRGLPLAATVAALVPVSVFIHVKDARGKPEKFEFLLPGEAGMDYVEYFKLIQAAGYRGPIVVEVSGQISNRPGYEPRQAAQRSFANLAPAFAKAGIAVGRKQ